MGSLFSSLGFSRGAPRGPTAGMGTPGFPAGGFRAWLPAGLLLLSVTGVLVAAALLGKGPSARSGAVAAVFHVGAPDDLPAAGPPAAERRKDSLYRQTQANLIK